ncbi:MAG: bifunctional ornithine acetyltransferase/N-acetylglutamate synthase [Oscillospiraceae bacterium]|nr:bifunctional ornithine acetyltransferase/N-acetylglutamate synthase [Oscillospiraceae bacterium]
MSIKQVEGGVCAAGGFLAGGVHCGLAKRTDKSDLALIYSKVPCTAAASYTTNKVQAAPIQVTQGNLEDGAAQAIICNSGNANACNADGVQVAERMCDLTGNALNLSPVDVIVASTGVIGQPLNVSLIEGAMTELVKGISAQPAGSKAAARAIMTTDLREKEVAVSFELNGKVCTLGGISKGSGMIHPNMATMLAFLTTDTAVSSDMLKEALGMVVPKTFNMVSVDGDTSTNDMCAILANGLAGNDEITGHGEDYDLFVKALTHVCIYLARIMARDGEGATKLLECIVTGAVDDKTAGVLAKSIICSNLVKCAMFGEDANWGRILCAMGYASADFDPAGTKVTLVSQGGEVTVYQNGGGLPFSEDEAAKVLACEEIEIQVELNQADGGAVAWGCDLSYDYVKINGDYRT